MSGVAAAAFAVRASAVRVFAVRVFAVGAWITGAWARTGTGSGAELEEDAGLDEIARHSGKPSLPVGCFLVMEFCHRVQLLRSIMECRYRCSACCAQQGQADVLIGQVGSSLRGKAGGNAVRSRVRDGASVSMVSDGRKT